MRVELEYPDDAHLPSTILELAVIPRVGEKIELAGNPIPLIVEFVTHRLVMASRGLVEHVTVIKTTFLSEPRYILDLLWQDESERPEWFPDEVFLQCDYIPRTGETITIGLVEPAFAAAFSAGENDGNVPKSRIVDVEIVAVVHGSFIQQLKEDRGLGFADLQTELQVRKATRAARGDIQRFLARAQRN